MYRIVSAVLSVTLMLLCFAVSCGGGGSSLSRLVSSVVNDAASAVDEDSSATTEDFPTKEDILPDTFLFTPLYTSSNGPSLYLLDEKGVTVNAKTGLYSVEEVEVDAETFEWCIHDLSGELRSHFLRIAATGDTWRPVDLRRGDWAPSQQALFTGINNSDNGLDIGVVPFSTTGEQPTEVQVLARVVFSTDAERVASICPEDRTRDSTFSTFEHNFYSYYAKSID